VKVPLIICVFTLHQVSYTNAISLMGSNIDGQII
jgi:hypothetical protein